MRFSIAMSCCLFLLKNPTRFRVVQSGKSWHFQVGQFAQVAVPEIVPPMPQRQVPVLASSLADGSSPSSGGNVPQPPPGLGMMPGSSTSIHQPASHGVVSWNVAQVVAYLDVLELSHVSDIVKVNAMDGRMLLDLVANEELMDVGFTKLQARKITMRLPS